MLIIHRDAAIVAGVSNADLSQAFKNRTEVSLKKLASEDLELALRVVGALPDLHDESRLFTLMLALKLHDAVEVSQRSAHEIVQAEALQAYKNHKKGRWIAPSLDIIGALFNGTPFSIKTVSLEEVAFCAVEESTDKNIAYRTYLAAASFKASAITKKIPSKLETAEEFRTRLLKQFNVEVRALLESCYV